MATYPARPAPGRALRAVLLVAGRELGAYFRTPLGYGVAVLFAALQGLSFWYVLGALANPSQPAPIGAVLFNHFGGSVLATTVIVTLVAALAMRLVAEDRRQGTWETLVTAPVPEGAVITGKWLGGCAFYAFAWLPSASYPLLLWYLTPASQSLDPGPIASSLLSVLLVGAAFMAVGVAASAATTNQILAALATTAVAVSCLLVGDIPAIAPQLAPADSWLGAALAHVRIRAHMDDMARGLVTLEALTLYTSITIVALTAAVPLALVGTRRSAALRARFLILFWVAAIALAGNILSVRHPLRWDLTRARVHTLDERTLAVLARVGESDDAPERGLEVLVVRAGLDGFAAIQDEVDRLLARMQRAQPALDIEYVDPTLEPARVAEIAAHALMPMENLRDGGVVVFARGGTRRIVDVLSMVEIGADDLGFGTLQAFRAERAFASAMDELLHDDRPVLCPTTGHGEMTLRPTPVRGAERGDDWSGIGQRLLDEEYRLEEAIDVLGRGVPDPCRVVIMAGPSSPVSPSDAQALAAFLERGGRLLLTLDEAAPPATDAPAPGREPGSYLGLELVLAEYGVVLPDVRVFDPSAAIDRGSAWYTTSGYGAHPITEGFQDRRVTVWLGPRAVVARPAGATGSSERDPRTTVLVHASERAEAMPTRGAHRSGSEPEAAVALAVEVPETGARLVVIGATRSLSPRLSQSHGSAGELLVMRALAWLAGRDRQLDIPARTPEQLRLLLTPTELRAAFAVCVLAIPGVLLLVGAIVWWRRRDA